MANIAALRVLLKELKLSNVGKQWEPLAQKALDERKRPFINVLPLFHFIRIFFNLRFHIPWQ